RVRLPYATLVRSPPAAPMTPLRARATTSVTRGRVAQSLGPAAAESGRAAAERDGIRRIVAGAMCPLPRSARYDRGRLQLDLARVVAPGRHEDPAHGRAVRAQVLAPDPAELAACRHVRRLVAAVRRHPADVLWLGARLGEDRNDVAQRLFELRRDLFGVESLLLVPADLAGDEHDASGLDLDAVRVADRRGPSFRKQGSHAQGLLVLAVALNRCSAADRGRRPSCDRASASSTASRG